MRSQQPTLPDSSPRLAPHPMTTAPPRPPDDASPQLRQPPYDASSRPPTGVLPSARAQAPSLNVTPSKSRKKRGRARKQSSSAISASATGRLVDSRQVASIAAAETAKTASSTVANGLRRSGRNKGFAVQDLDNVYQHAEKKLINSVGAANEAGRKARQAFHDAETLMATGDGASGGGGDSRGRGGSSR
ncbi:hypothetical protein FN846DRAFT_885977 [Sphaerosporella brunnea]|uniref:Uncharacterized protein n=1 Tax=Sphaerosporella brunnea TaxID=1250544 RepID=A0A5J5FAY6_9PEZI|nr:hypothetical protein FN846DRAFT_885965 [Sphaerosporella brunnea]KAA8914360.1 hypothetical protein FN846DRAFT_885977 [Sphaerosporella brunnea]